MCNTFHYITKILLSQLYKGNFQRQGGDVNNLFTIKKSY